MSAETKCHACGSVAAEFICHACKTERPAYTALKSITAKTRAPYPHCVYYPKSLCACDGRGECLGVA